MKSLLILFLKGMVIGFANLIPGVTLATAAFLIGSYTHILQALRSLNITALRYAYEKRWRNLEQHIPWRLLVMMPLGIFISTYLLPLLLPITYWESLYKPKIYAFICGLILGGLGFAIANHRGAGFSGFLLFFAGLCASTLPLTMQIHPLPVSWEYQFFTGIVGTLTEMIPGIPESVSHKLTGDYQALAYYSDRGYWPATLLFIAGVVVGLLLILSLLALMFRRFQEQTTSLLFGLTAGVMLQLWPLRFMQNNAENSLMMVGICFASGVTVSALLQFVQRRTLA
jgi:putative membrane protein